MIVIAQANELWGTRGITRDGARQHGQQSVVNEALWAIQGSSNKTERKQ